MVKHVKKSLNLRRRPGLKNYTIHIGLLKTASINFGAMKDLFLKLQLSFFFGGIKFI